LKTVLPQLRAPINFMHENRETSDTPAAKPGLRSGEGDCRTGRAKVSEGSNNGMNLFNNDKTSFTKRGEGRPLIKENAGQT
jgi:hypothetical protein